MKSIFQINEAAKFVSNRISSAPRTGVILGSGLGGLVSALKESMSIRYADIPHFPVSTVVGHRGELIVGELNRVPVWVLNGRFHYYEGYDLDDVVFPLRVLRALGLERIIITNAAGGLNPSFEAGDIMLIEDIISLMPANPLRGKNLDEFGPRFPDMSEPFCSTWMKQAIGEAENQNINLRKGTYVGLTGPKLETKAEINYCRLIGGDAVGMSTVSEVIAANHMGIKVLGFSVITNESIPKVKKEFTHEEVVDVANKAGATLAKLIKRVL
ncbi:Purine nucleoside phosphorylase [Mariniradius saccharolyticus AK6]|uniref:Purine nucleoside phosphorylase n=1 Tax=Mariniradius saccharolyticus AK6 TaxID=1239962 RepID=M7Y297_9BACT|nr:purine-nucleoside phosphorylase [Mariniradius saccharolyticus]EMS31336.1 Purine nucleoside phosphorylase [Mariniradius saccharolyticus AK6]